MNQTIKKSHQRDAIINYLKTRKDHPTAEQIYSTLKSEMPNLSLGTVYRNLALLTETNQILKLSSDGKIDHYDANTNPHYHIICTKCGAYDDIDMPYDNSINAAAADYYEGTIESHFLLFHGLCPSCSKKENN